MFESVHRRPFADCCCCCCLQAQAGYAGAALIVTGLIGAGTTCHVLDRTKRFIRIMRGLFLAGSVLITAVCRSMSRIQLTWCSLRWSHDRAISPESSSFAPFSVRGVRLLKLLFQSAQVCARLAHCRSGWSSPSRRHSPSARAPAPAFSGWPCARRSAAALELTMPCSQVFTIIIYAIMEGIAGWYIRSRSAK